MFELRDQFILKNRDRLQSYYTKVSDKRRGVMGFGYRSPQETFKAVLEDGKDFYLPLCLLQLFWDFDDPDTREFVLSSLSELYNFEEDLPIEDTVMAYVHAYCLCKLDADDDSYRILTALGQQCFPPALVSMGDACIAHHRIKDTIAHYVHAIDHGHLSVFTRLRKIVRKDAHFPRTFFIRIIGFGHFMKSVLGIAKRGVVGEHLLYLDFYGLRHHMENYWAHPKAERKKLRKTAQATIS